jgi:hypothetical protein
MNQWWLLFKMVVLTFVPLPLNPKITRPDPNKHFWTFECTGFTSCFKTFKIFYSESRTGKQLAEKSD